MLFNINTDLHRNIHFIGIGGISMSGIAEILLKNNFNISGSDVKEGLTTKRLRNLGAKIYIGQIAENISDDIDLIVYTDAISKDNPELLKAFTMGVPVVDRATFLGALMKNYEDSIAISGTHGKTTTTSILSTILNKSNLEPTILLGGQLKDIGGNIKIGDDKLILTEACEYKANLLKYFPTIGVILNIDEDHLDYYTNIQHIIDTFKRFASNIKKDGLLIINNDDENIKEILDDVKAKVISFGFNDGADYKAENIRVKDGITYFDLIAFDKLHKDFTLHTLGKHNIANSLAAISVSHQYGLTIEEIKEYLSKYRSVARRLEYKGRFNGTLIIDDYAHHPTEIQATLKAVRAANKNSKIYCIFQPHTYTRTQKLFVDFSKSFKDADMVLITDIFAARESDPGTIHSKDLSEAIENTQSIYIKDFTDIENYLKENINEDDIIITMGAGDVYEIGNNLLEIEE